MAISYYYNQGTETWIPLMDINVPSHNDTTSLQGGTAGQYYHLTAAQNTNIGNVTTAGWALLDDADNAAQRTTLGLGSMATETATNYVAKSLFDANTILYATTDNTPVALTLAANTIPGRSSTGDIVAKSCTDAGFALLDDATAADQAHTLGLGTGDSPQFQGLTILGSAGVGKFCTLDVNGTPCVYRAGTDLTNNTPLFVYRRARGTLDTPLSVLNNYGIGSFEMGAYDGSAYTSGWDGGVGFMGAAAEDWSSSAHGARLWFLTTPIGATDWVIGMTLQASGNLSIGTTTDSASAILNVASTTKGALLPRMTTAQRDAISTPVEGMLIYNTTTHCLDHYNGSAWAAV